MMSLRSITSITLLLGMVGLLAPVGAAGKTAQAGPPDPLSAGEHGGHIFNYIIIRNSGGILLILILNRACWPQTRLSAVGWRL